MEDEDSETFPLLRTSPSTSPTSSSSSLESSIKKEKLRQHDDLWDTLDYELRTCIGDSLVSESYSTSESLQIVDSIDTMEYITNISVGQLSRIGFRRSLWTNKSSSYFVIFTFLMNYESFVTFPILFDRFGASSPIVYFFCMCLVGLPLIYMELALGQYTSTNVITVFDRIAPAFSGLGLSILLLDFLTLLNDQIFQHSHRANAVAQLRDPRKGPDCHSRLHDDCGRDQKMTWLQDHRRLEELQINVAGNISPIGDSCSYANIPEMSISTTTTSFNSWFASESLKQTLFPDLNMDMMEVPEWPSAYVLILILLAWTTIAAFSEMKRHHIVMIAKLAVIIQLSFIFLCISLMFITPPLYAYLPAIVEKLDFENWKVWTVSVLHVIRSSKLGQGRLIFIGAQNRFHNNISRDVLVIFAYMLFVPFFNAIFYNLSLHTHVLQMVEGSVATHHNFVDSAAQSRVQSHYLHHIQFSFFLHSLQIYESYESFIIFVFSLVVILMMIIGKVVQLEYYVATISEKFAVASTEESRTIIVQLVCVVGCLGMLPIFATTGMDIVAGLQLVVLNGAGCVLVLLEVLVVAYVYGGRRLTANITAMSTARTKAEDCLESLFNVFAVLVWCLVVPAVLVCVLVLGMWSPVMDWVTSWFVTLIIIGIVPVVMVQKILSVWNSRKTVASLFKPVEELWGARSAVDNRAAKRAERQIRSIF